MTDFEKALEAWRLENANRTIGNLREVFKAGWDAAIKRQAELVEALEFYANGWIEKHARKDQFGYIQTVWKNPVVQADHGERARQILSKLKAKGGV